MTHKTHHKTNILLESNFTYLQKRMILNARVTNLSLFIECLPSKNIDVFSEAEPLNEKISKHRILLIIRINLTFSL